MFTRPWMCRRTTSAVFGRVMPLPSGTPFFPKIVPPCPSRCAHFFSDQPARRSPQRFFFFHQGVALPGLLPGGVGCRGSTRTTPLDSNSWTCPRMSAPFAADGQGRARHPRRSRKGRLFC
jgi:hypothetical protein